MFSTQAAAGAHPTSAAVAHKRPCGPQRDITGARQLRRAICSSAQPGGRGRDGPSPPLPLSPPARAVDRRALLALLAAANMTLPTSQAAAAEAAAAPAAPATTPPKVVQPLPVPPLTETFMSPEGFAFNYPEGWVVAFDRSGSTGNGAVVVVGDFRKLITVSVFRTETVPAEVATAGLDEEGGYGVCVEPARADRGTMRFQLLRSEMAADGSGAYEYAYSLESCAGDIEEGLRGRLRCLSAFGGTIPTTPRRYIGRCVLIKGTAYSLNASSTEERWPEVAQLLQAVVDTFRA